MLNRADILAVAEAIHASGMTTEVNAAKSSVCRSQLERNPADRVAVDTNCRSSRAEYRHFVQALRAMPQIVVRWQHSPGANVQFQTHAPSVFEMAHNSYIGFRLRHASPPLPGLHRIGHSDRRQTDSPVHLSHQPIESRSKLWLDQVLLNANDAMPLSSRQTSQGWIDHSLMRCPFD